MRASRALLIPRIPLPSSFSCPRAAPRSYQLLPNSLSSEAHCLLQYRCVVYNKITKNKLLLNKTRDSSYENFMDDEKKMNVLTRIVKLLLKQPEQKMLYRYMLRRGGYVGLVRPQKMGAILDKYPRIVRVYRNPNELDVWVTPAKPILQLLKEEKKLKLERAQLASERLRRVLMLSSTRRIRLDRINYLKEELGLPDDFKKTVVKANPHLFKLVITRVNLEKGVSPSVKLLEWDEKIAVPAIEAFRQDPASVSGLDEEGKKKKAYAFPINFPPNFKIKKGFRSKVKSWQELPYRSPYADTSDLDLQSPEAFKRAVAVIHEFLHITVEKRTIIDHLAHLREDYKLPQRLGVTVLQNPGIFYMSTKSNKQTIFLREGYRKGELLERDPLMAIKEKFLELIRMGRKSVTKSRAGKHTISDSDTSEDEMETSVIKEDVSLEEARKDEKLKETSPSRKFRKEGEELCGDGYDTCSGDEVGQESWFSDETESYSSGSEMESNKHTVGKIKESCLKIDEESWFSDGTEGYSSGSEMESDKHTVGKNKESCLEIDELHDVAAYEVEEEISLEINKDAITKNPFETDTDLEGN